MQFKNSHPLRYNYKNS